MNLLLRLIKVLLTAIFRGRDIAPLDECELSFRVRPTDLDLNGHMNNGRYVAIMDLGRIDMVVRVGLLKQILRRGWRPVVASTNIQFRLSLAPFQRYKLITRVVCWNEKWFFVEQQFRSDGKLVAIGLVKGAFVKAGEKIPSDDVLRSINTNPIPSPPMTPAIEAWQCAQRLVIAGFQAAVPPTSAVSQ